MTTDQHKQLNELLADDGDCLSDWEIDFLESLNRDRHLELTGGQEYKLTQIWNRVFG